MIDILVYLFENFHDFSSHPKPEALARKLSAEGFADDEITEALIWLAGLKGREKFEVASDGKSIRLYSSEEQDRLGADCIGFVHFLETAGVINPTLRELIVERGLLLEDHPVPLDKFKIIVLMVLWSRAQVLEPLIVEELLSDLDSDTFH